MHPKPYADACLGATQCVASTETPSCNVGFYLDLTDYHICRVCAAIASCPSGSLHCSNGKDSVCGSCSSGFNLTSMVCGGDRDWEIIPMSISFSLRIPTEQLLRLRLCDCVAASHALSKRWEKRTIFFHLVEFELELKLF